MRAHLTSHSLSAEERSGQVDIVDPPPLVCLHLNGMCAPDNAGEAAEHIHATEHLCGAFHSRSYLCFVSNVYGFGHDSAVGETCVKLLDGLECGVRIHVP